MKLMRIGERGRERPQVALDGGLVLDVSDLTPDFTPEFLAGGGLDRLRAHVAEHASRATALPEATRVGSPIPRPGKIVCIGLNYADHAAETGAPVPTEPVLFMKAANTLVGPNDDVYVPRGSAKTDYEVELGVLIGTQARYLAGDHEAAVEASLRAQPSQK